MGFQEVDSCFERRREEELLGYKVMLQPQLPQQLPGCLTTVVVVVAAAAPAAVVVAVAAAAAEAARQSQGSQSC